MNPLRTALAVWLASSFVAFGDTVPKGFEGKGVLDRVLSGEVLVNDAVDSATQMQAVYRAYYHGVSPDRFVDAITDHAHYSELFSEVVRGKTLSVNANRTQWDYSLELKVKMGLFSTQLSVTGRQKVVPAADLVSEWIFANEITSNRQQLRKAINTLRLIPFRNGFLVHSVYDLELQSGVLVGGAIKKRLHDEGLRQIKAFRKELRAEP